MPRRRNEEPENHERWLVSYADFITLLFAFFVVMYATGQQDIKKAEEFQKNVRKQFNILMAQINVGGGGANSDPAQGITDALANPKAGPKEVGAAVNTILEGQMTEKERNEAIESLRTDSNGVRMSLSAQNYFEKDSFKIRTEALPALRKIGGVLERSNRALVIEGHSFSKRKGIGKDSWDLSALRANQILRYFVKNHDVNQNRVVSISYGSTRPVVQENIQQADKKNNRIEILIITEDLKL